MRPESPVIPLRSYPEVIYANEQPEYLPLPVIRETNGVLTCRWHMTTWNERIMALFTGDVYLQIMTFNHPLQPVKVSIEPPVISITESL